MDNTYNGLKSSDDIVSSLTLDKNANVYVTGFA